MTVAGPEVTPYGSWPSPLTASLATSGGLRFGSLAVGHDAAGEPIVWSAQMSGGLMRVHRSNARAPGEVVKQVTSARSRVNEYGGGALWCHGATLFWVEDDDQCIRRLAPDDDSPVLLTRPGPAERSTRWAAGVVGPDGRWMVVEREVHLAEDGTPLDEALNDLAWLPTDGSADPVSLVGGADFSGAPVVSPDGQHLAWLQWNHPDMPWDAAELWAARLKVGDTSAALVGPRRVAGGSSVAACLPLWSPLGTLWWCDDREDAWLLRSAAAPGLPPAGSGDGAAAVRSTEADVGEPRWVSGGGRYGFVGDDVVLVETVLGLDRIVRLPGAAAGRATGEPVEAPAGGLPSTTWVQQLVASGDTVAVVAGRPTDPTSVLVGSQPADGAGWADLGTTRWPTPVESISTPEPITFPTGADGSQAVAHGIFYAPRLQGHEGPPGEAPPLVVRIHGGPTGYAFTELSPSIQFWTTRGFAVVEVNYRGSAGFGRGYRRLLDGGWGEVEVQDCIAAAEHLAGTGRVDPARCVIRGGSAGGFTALEAVCAPATRSGFHFAAATTLYGVTDLMALAGDTHKFESRYLDGLVGPLPQTRDRYEARSPIQHPERISVPVLVLQGLEDRVVPPEQAEVLVAALEANGIDHEYRAYEGEGHGFRNPSTVVDALEAELAFYTRVLALG
ncbi:MAG: S9 family peptidase [Actinomycetia bacterium]|nr:S9 family peptidase [Actinomycetes bacterium]